MTDDFYVVRGVNCREFECLRCGAKKGKDCEDEMTRQHLFVPHPERVRECRKPAQNEKDAAVARLDKAVAF